jgi:hypothetical protein
MLEWNRLRGEFADVTKKIEEANEETEMGGGRGRPQEL